MLRFFKVLVLVLTVLMLTPARAAAQNRPLSQLLRQLYGDAIFNEINAFASVLPKYNIQVDQNALVAAGVRRLSEAGQIIGLAGNQLSSFPLASASGGFTWIFDASSGGTLTWGPSDFGGSQYPQFHLSPGEDLNLLLGSVGVKANPFRNMLLTANVLFPLTSSGLTARLTWMAGVDYSF
jgi:hypothetical protein